jgi:triacylglycerol lipase
MLREAFERLDRNQDGLLDAQEAPAYARHAAPLSCGGFQAVLDALPVPPAPAPRPRAKNPVLILPGFLMPEWSYDALRRRLALAGYGQVAVLSGWPWCDTIPAYARAAREAAEALRARTGAAKVDLVCHSMGGLVGRYLIQELGYEDRVDHFVSYGTPHHGTLIGPLASWYAKSAGEMTPGSAFLAALNAREGRPSAIKYTSVHAQFDEIVFPHESVDLRGAENPEVPRALHITGVLTPEVARSILDGLAR